MNRIIGFLCIVFFQVMAISQEIGIEMVVARGPHSDVHQVVEEVLQDGESNTVVREWEVLQSGLNFWSEADQAWVPSSKNIDLAESGAVFKNGPIKIRFAANQNDINGSIEFTLPFPDQRTIKMQTIGIALTDGENSVWIGEVQDSHGLLDGNSIIYPNAFSGIKADIQVRVEDAGQFHNDVVLRERVEPALLQALQMDPARCRLEIWHQILQCPQGVSHPGSVKRVDGSIDFDEQLEFGEPGAYTSFYIGPGAAFLVGANRTPIANLNGTIPVAKKKFKEPQTDFSFLVESIPYVEAQAALEALPAREQAFNFDNLKREVEKTRLTASRTERGKPTRVSSITIHPEKRRDRQVAAMTRGRHTTKAGFVMDYIVVPTIANYRFNGVATYYVTNSVTLSGTTTLEKGTVVKFANTGNPVLNVTGAVDCQTALGMPAIFTAKDDDSVGEVISGSSGAPVGTYGVYNLLFTGSNLDIHDIHTRFAQTGLGFQGSSINTANIQVIRCTLGIESCNNTLTVRNLLAHNTTTVFGGTNTTINAEHVTAHVATQLFTYSGTGALNLTNSMVIGVTNASGTGITKVSTQTITDDTGIFQTVKAGAHYLADGSPFRNAGTATLSSAMLAILPKTTTYPPIELTGTISAPVTLGPQARRDTDLPDLGAHFAPIDYIWGSLTVGNTTLTLTNGVAVALYGTGATVCNSGAKIVSEGTPQNLNRIFRYQAVQEQPTLLGSIAANMSLFETTSPATKPQLTLRFSQLFMPANSSARRTLTKNVSTTEFGDTTSRDSEWHNISQGWDLASGPLNIDLKNNIFSRCALSPTRYMYTHQMQFTFYNNLVMRADLSLSYLTTTSSPPTWIVRDNLFVSGSIGSYAPYPYVLVDHNGYYDTFVPSFTGGSDQTQISNDFVTGSLGPYYYPTSGSGLFRLVDAGSRLASSANMFHYTTRADDNKESGTVDIGFHYVAVDGNGNPTDTDSDGIPDYAEDLDGDGVVDSTETNYAIGVRILSPSRAASLP